LRRREKPVDRLWAPWRSKYIYLRKRKGCIFCGAEKARDPAGRLIIERSASSFAMLNLYPYNNGHVMVAPYRHVPSLDRLDDGQMLDLMRLLNRVKARIDSKMRPHGYNIGANIGAVSGAGYAGHVHIHIVPRWKGDTNFIPVVSGVKVVSESLEAMYRALKAGPGQL
jgi:ATP adenylyltransferase